MPVEIKELVIRMTAATGKNGAAGKPVTGQPSMDEATLVEACVKQVLRILEKKKLR